MCATCLHRYLTDRDEFPVWLGEPQLHPDGAAAGCQLGVRCSPQVRGNHRQNPEIVSRKEKIASL